MDICVKKCPKCNKEFKVTKVYYPTKIDDKRESYIDCPYCGYIVENIRLLGDEDVPTSKI